MFNWNGEEVRFELKTIDYALIDHAFTEVRT